MMISGRRRNIDDQSRPSSRRFAVKNARSPGRARLRLPASSGTPGFELVFHLHRFDDDDGLPRTHRLSSFDANAHDLAGHRGDDSLGAGTRMSRIVMAAPPSIERYGNLRGAD